MLLPTDVRYDQKNFTSLFLKRTSIPTRRKVGALPTRTGSNEGLQEGGYADMGGNDHDMDMDAPEVELNLANLDYMGGHEIEMLPEPKRVQEIMSNYAKVDKRVDVKMLKRNIWDQLMQVPETTEYPDLHKASSDLLASMEENGPAKDVEGPKSFQTVLETLPGIVPESALLEVSVPYCFVCLLHLANEKNLSLTAPSDMNTLIINQM